MLLATRYGGLRAPAGPSDEAAAAASVRGYVLLIAAALAVRLIGLADRPFHHDESQDAYFSWLFYTRRRLPVPADPPRAAAVLPHAAMYLLFGDSDFTARLAPALMGTLMVAAAGAAARPARPRRRVRGGAALAFGPSYLYYCRFAREDIYIACITLALLAVTFRFLDRPRRHQPALIGALLALCFATKESTFITVFVAGTFLPGAVRAGARRGAAARTPVVHALAASAGAGLGRRRLRGRLHAAVHRRSSPTRRAVGRAVRRPRLLARAARRGPRRRARWYFYGSCCSPRSCRCCCSAPSAWSARAPPDAVAAVPDLGRSCSRSPSTRWAGESSPGWCCTRCCR